MIAAEQGALVEVEITGSDAPGVMDGLRLYRAQTGSAAPDETLRGDWLRWIQGAPSARGACAIARDGERVVGFYALLPTEMYLGGSPVPGAKGEFYAVDPGYRRARAAEGGMPVPFALVALLKRRAPELGIQASFGKTTKGAFVTMATGARPVEFEHVDYLSLFRPAGLGRGRGAALRELGAVAATTLLRGAGAARGALEGAAGAVRQVDAFAPGDVRDAGGRNHLVNPAARALDLRFPADRYAKYVVEGADGRPAHFVFSRPRAGGMAQLMDWATLRVPPAVLRALLRRVARDCRRAGAAALHLPIPAAEDDPALGLAGAGFLRARRGKSVVYVTCATPELARARDEGPWRFTNAHASYYDDGGAAPRADEEGAA